MTGPAIEPDGSPSPLPTQVQHPWHAMARTVFQLVVALAAALPALVGYLHLPTTAGLAAALGIAMVITRVMAMPEVNEALRRWVPWLAAEPPGNAG